MSRSKTLTNSMSEIGRVINGVLMSDEILAIIAPFGYTEERVRTEGLSMYEQVNSLIVSQRKEYGEQYTATQTGKEQWNSAYGEYMQILRLSRIALKNKPGALHSLHATGSRSRSMSGFIKESRVLFGNLKAQPEYLAEVAKFGVSEAKIDAAAAMVDEMETSYQVFLKEKGEAQSSTIERDKAYDALYDWYSDFRAVLHIALGDYPQLLENLGIIVKRKN